MRSNSRIRAIVRLIEQVTALRWARTATASSADFAGQDDRSAGRLWKMLVGYRCAGADAPLLPLLPRSARVPPRRRMRYLDRSQPSKASLGGRAKTPSPTKFPAQGARRHRSTTAVAAREVDCAACFQIAIAFDFDKRPKTGAGRERKIRRCVLCN
jgi:hypothetical protein